MKNKLDRILFGKKYLKKPIREKILIVRRLIILTLFMNILLISLCGFLVISWGDLSIVKKGEISLSEDVLSMVSIKYENLTKEEIEIFEDVFKELNPLYLYDNKNFLVVKNISEYCEKCIGQNIGNGREIQIEFHNDKNYLRRILSHEIMHTYFSGDNGDTIRHDIIYDLGWKEVVFD